jgi:hypothetical protein
MMTRHLLIRDFSDRGTSSLSGVIAELCSLGEKASLRMSLSELLAASGTNNPSPGRQSIQIRRHPLTERSFLEH